MQPTSLTDFYNGLKSGQDYGVTKPIKVDDEMWKNKMKDNCSKLKDKCCKHILLDIYCKVLPLDKEYIDGHQGDMSSDVDGMLAQKGMGPVEYFRACFESTNAPLVKFLLESSDVITKQYMEAAEKEKKDAEENGMEAPEMPEPDVEEPEIQSALVDVESDDDYTNFVEKLKKKTVEKIVDDISEMIADKQKEDDMTYQPNEEAIGESAVLTAMDYLQKQTWTESVETDTLMGYAIREATMHELDNVFNLPGKSYNEYASRIRFGKGYLINESAMNSLK